MAQEAYAMFGADCPRCGQARTTFDILAATQVSNDYLSQFEAFLRCRSCSDPSIGLLEQKFSTAPAPTESHGAYTNSQYNLERWVFEPPSGRSVPGHVPPEIGRIFSEGAKCAAIAAWDASGAMFRKTLDVATRSITPKPDSTADPRPASWKIYKDLRLRLDWLFEKGLLSSALKDLSSCIHEDGNDAAHDVDGIKEPEAQDLGDFCERVLEALYTVPGQIAENRRRRDERRGASQSQEVTADAQ